MSNSTAADAIATAAPEAVVRHIDAFLENRRLTRQQVADIYDQWSGTYEADLARVPLGYNNPGQLTDAFARQVPASGRELLRILDVACGTGLVGERLRRLGFLRVDGVDGSAKMVEEARKKAVYENLFVELIGSDGRPLRCAQPRTYDALLTTGSFCPNHLAPCCLRQLGALVKPGGIVGIGMRKEFCTSDPVLQGMEPELLRLKSEGLWEIALWQEQPFYYGSQSGMFYLLRVN